MASRLNPVTALWLVGRIESGAGLDLDMEEVGADVHGDGFASVDHSNADPVGCSRR